MRSKTLSVAVDASPEKVYGFVSNLENLPKWAKAFCRSVRKSGNDWILETSRGGMKIRMTPENPFGVLDHFVSPPGAPEIFVPMRVVANGGGSEVLFTLFQHPGMTGDQFAGDIRMVEQDLAGLKSAVES